jgi:hypothetical protein
MFYYLTFFPRPVDQTPKSVSCIDTSVKPFTIAREICDTEATLTEKIYEGGGPPADETGMIFWRYVVFFVTHIRGQPNERTV